jgi:imidazolonepropionase
LNESSEEEIYNQSKVRLEEVMRLGTGAEIKSGYGLTLEGELKMLHVIKRLSQNYPVAIKATLCAHAFPLEYKDNHQGYIDMLIDEIIPEIAKHELAQYIDVFRIRLLYCCRDRTNYERELNLA